MKQASKNKNIKAKIKDWLVGIGLCLGLILMGAEGDDWNVIWVNLSGIAILFAIAFVCGAFKKENI